MCGICGVIQLRGEPRQVVAPEVLDRMTDAMTHRGPDDRGTYVADGVAFGVRRLSIVDVVDGHQPFANEDETIWAIQNGELFNHASLGRDLNNRGHRLRTRCDTEIIPHLYEEAGPAFPRQLRGMFGIAVWDAPNRRATLVRDRLGIKPLYYAQSGDLLVFGSELKSVLASGLVDTDLDYEAIDTFLTLGFVPAPMTPLRCVRKLLPGHRLTVDRTGARTEAYWSYPEPAPVGLTLEESAEALMSLLRESVQLRLMSDVPLGAMLSGGLDSSVIVALMAEQMSEPVKTFSVGFAEAADGNELADARLVASVFGTDHHELELSLADTPVDLADLVWHLDEPVADLSALGFFALSQLAADHVTVALSGQGADELLGGYQKHRAAAISGLWSRLPAPLRSTGLSALRQLPGDFDRIRATLAAPDAAARLLATSANLSSEMREQLVRGPLAKLGGGSARRILLERLGRVSSADPLSSSLYLDAQLGLVDDMLHYFDRASMAHSLEVRVPFLDHHVVEFCASIPPHHKVRRLDTKHVLKRAVRGMIPDKIIDKPKVGFFNRAVNDWFRSQAAGAVGDYLLSPNARYAEILERKHVESLLPRRGQAQPAAATRALLPILMLEVWLSSYLEKATAPPTQSWEPVAV